MGVLCVFNTKLDAHFDRCITYIFLLSIFSTYEGLIGMESHDKSRKISV